MSDLKTINILKNFPSKNHGPASSDCFTAQHTQENVHASYILIFGKNILVSHAPVMAYTADLSYRLIT